MQLITESGIQSDYYQVVVKPFKNSSDVSFKTAYRLDQYGWNEAMRHKSVRLDQHK
jgi:uncharacterized protein with NAD-binding domain and iron-sulfur cluster